MTSVMQAVASRNYEAIDLLLDFGADINAVDKDGGSVKAWAFFLKMTK
jgi:ankyrin repeat protein